MRIVATILVMQTDRVLSILQRQYPHLPIHRLATTPFRTLIVTLISQRARDDQIIPVAKKLFSIADTPKKILSLDKRRLKKIIKPTGKYIQNTERIMTICRILIEDYKGNVPQDEKQLLSLPGVGRKTANIVLANCFDRDVIAVDTHVHRITNRLGWVKTKSTEDTERELHKIIPKKYRRIVNRVFVRHGQVICKPVSPFCSLCPIFSFCKRVQVGSSR